MAKGLSSTLPLEPGKEIPEAEKGFAEETMPDFKNVTVRDVYRNELEFPAECVGNEHPDYSFCWVPTSDVDEYRGKGFVPCNRMSPRQGFWTPETLSKYLNPAHGALGPLNGVRTTILMVRYRELLKRERERIKTLTDERLTKAQGKITARDEETKLPPTTPRASLYSDGTPGDMGSDSS